MSLEDLKNLQQFLEGLGLIATDIFWGNYPGISDEEQALLTSDEYGEAYSEACIDYMNELCEKEVNWVHELNCDMAYRYGMAVKRRILKKELERMGK